MRKIENVKNNCVLLMKGVSLGILVFLSIPRYDL